MTQATNYLATPKNQCKKWKSKNQLDVTERENSSKKVMTALLKNKTKFKIWKKKNLKEPWIDSLLRALKHLNQLVCKMKEMKKLRKE